MKITWLGHSCFKVESRGYAVVLDPYEDGSVPGCLPVRETADEVLCSHEHFDHNFRAGVTLRKPEGKPLKVETISTWHDDKNGELRGSNKIHILDDGQVRAAHMGDLGCGLAPEQLEMLKGVDVILIPVGVVYIAETLSDIIQVGYFKLTHGKRFFKMAPLHHHLELSGWSEAKLVTVFSAVTLVFCVLAWLGIQGRY